LAAPFHEAARVDAPGFEFWRDSFDKRWTSDDYDGNVNGVGGQQESLGNAYGENAEERQLPEYVAGANKQRYRIDDCKNDEAC